MVALAPAYDQRLDDREGVHAACGRGLGERPHATVTRDGVLQTGHGQGSDRRIVLVPWNAGPLSEGRFVVVSPTSEYGPAQRTSLWHSSQKSKVDCEALI